MLNTLKEILEQSEADAWEITETRVRGWEFYFIRHQLDQNRAKRLTDIHVKVYRKFEDGKYLGSASAGIAPDSTPEEIRRLTEALCKDAEYVKNPAYTLNQPQAAEKAEDHTFDIQQISRDFLETMNVLPETETEDLNSYEVFVSEIHRRFLNSEGIDVTTVYPSSMVEAVVNARNADHEIELYRLYHSGSCDSEQLTRDLSETLRYGRDKLNAGPTPALEKADVVFSTDAALEIYDWFIYRMSAAMIVRGVSDWKAETPVAEELNGERITLRTLRYLPNSSDNGLYDAEGALRSDLTLIEDGVAKHHYGSRQFSQYMGLGQSFIPSNYEVLGGHETAESLRTGRYLEVVEFSDFQVNALNGDIAGEIRLGYWHDGESVTPVSGGSISGTMRDFVKTLRYSTGRRQYDTHLIPAVTRLKDVTITGAE